MVDKFGGSFEHALAAYNAGSDRVEEWMGQGQYRDSPEFVESIPFTETREYVQAIMRNASRVQAALRRAVSRTSSPRISRITRINILWIEALQRAYCGWGFQLLGTAIERLAGGASAGVL